MDGILLAELRIQFWELYDFRILKSRRIVNRGYIIRTTYKRTTKEVVAEESGEDGFRYILNVNVEIVRLDIKISIKICV